MAMVLHVLDGGHIDTFCRYENGFGVYFNWILQPTPLRKVGFVRQLTALFIGKEGW